MNKENKFREEQIPSVAETIDSSQIPNIDAMQGMIGKLTTRTKCRCICTFMSLSADGVSLFAKRHLIYPVVHTL